jgi:hypothetical protein
VHHLPPAWTLEAEHDPSTLYGHMFKGADGKAADAIDALLGGN